MRAIFVFSFVFLLCIPAVAQAGCPKGFQLESPGILQPDVIKRVKSKALRGGKICIALRRPQLHKGRFSCPKPMKVEKSRIIVKAHRKRLLTQKINKGKICVLFAPPSGASTAKKAVKKAPPQKKVPQQTPEELAKARKQYLKDLKKKFKKEFPKCDVLPVDWPKVGIVVLVGGKFDDDEMKDLKVFRASDNALLYSLSSEDNPYGQTMLMYHKLKKSYVRKDNTFVVRVKVAVYDEYSGCEWKTKLALCASPGGDELGICWKEGVGAGPEGPSELNMPKKCQEDRDDYPR